MRIGFIGLGNVGSQLAGNLLNHGADVTVRDLDPKPVELLVSRGAKASVTTQQLAASVDLVNTCLPSPAACREVMEGPDGVLAGLTPGKIWLEMSTTDQSEVQRSGALVHALGGFAMDCPVSGGCHRAATGNISIFAGGARATFERVLPVLAILGQRSLHTGRWDRPLRSRS
jgi:3-hydroxyisobutyrate dehydrogenase